MHTMVPSFSVAVRLSRALSSEQKQEFLDAEHELPDAYKLTIASLLSSFDDRSREREANLRDQVTRLFDELRNRLERAQISPETRAETLKKAQELLSGLFPQSQA